jgi:TfoX/Sxy family transcriptional regulator of competence genes
MAYNQALADRIRVQIIDKPGFSEKKMFGGIGFMLRGNMACGVNKENLIARVGAEKYEDALTQPHTRPFDFTGRPMTGWVMVAPEGYKTDDDLRDWLRLGVECALSLPPK